MMLRRDAHARISDLHDHRVDRLVLGARRTQPHAAAGGRELDRVAEQVAHDVRDLFAIGRHRRQVRFCFDPQREPLLLEQGLVQ
jgi:hypothetical protein